MAFNYPLIELLREDPDAGLIGVIIAIVITLVIALLFNNVDNK